MIHFKQIPNSSKYQPIKTYRKSRMTKGKLQTFFNLVIIELRIVSFVFTFPLSGT